MKVPNMYKSSDRYNAGTDVIYNDGSKLQYAPFIYATTESGDNGGEEEEGEDTMVVKFSFVDNSYTIDKTWLEISNACIEGKNVIGYDIPSDWYEIPSEETSTSLLKFELAIMQHNIIEEQEVFVVNFTDYMGELYTFVCHNATDIPVYSPGD